MRRSSHTQIQFAHPPLSAIRNSAKLLSAWKRVLASGMFVRGKENEALAKELTRHLRQGHITLVASGHDALALALAQLHLSPKDEVVFPVNAYPTAFPVALSGATPVPCDVNMHGQLDPETLKKRLSPRTKAVIMVHMYGLTGDIAAVKTICRKRHITLLEDAAQSFGGTWGNRPLGTLGDMGCFSFYPTKNLGSTGEGGAIWTRTRAKTLSQATQYGETRRYHSAFVSGHSRIPELQAAGLRVYLEGFSTIQKKRMRAATWYHQAITDMLTDMQVRPLASHPKSNPVPHLFVAEVTRRKKLRTYLAKRRIPTAVHYPTPVHLIPAFASLGYKRGDFPKAERLSTRILSLPFHEYLTKNQIYYIVHTIRSFYAHTS